MILVFQIVLTTETQVNVSSCQNNIIHSSLYLMTEDKFFQGKLREFVLSYVFSAVPPYIQRQWAHCKDRTQKKAAIISPKAYLAGKLWNKMKLQTGWSRGMRSSRKENLKAEMSFMCEDSGISSLFMVHSIFPLLLLWKDIQVVHFFHLDQPYHYKHTEMWQKIMLFTTAMAKSLDEVHRDSLKRIILVHKDSLKCNILKKKFKLNQWWNQAWFRMWNKFLLYLESFLKGLEWPGKVANCFNNWNILTRICDLFTKPASEL